MFKKIISLLILLCIMLTSVNAVYVSELEVNNLTVNNLKVKNNINQFKSCITRDMLEMANVFDCKLEQKNFNEFTCENYTFTSDCSGSYTITKDYTTTTPDVYIIMLCIIFIAGVVIGVIFN